MSESKRRDAAGGKAEPTACKANCTAYACQYNKNGVCSAGFGVSLVVDAEIEENNRAAAAE